MRTVVQCNLFDILFSKLKDLSLAILNRLPLKCLTFHIVFTNIFDNLLLCFTAISVARNTKSLSVMFLYKENLYYEEFNCSIDN